MELRHERRGNGPRLLLVHGLGASLAVWRPLMDRLAREREVVAVDMPGFGGSAPLENGIVPSPENIARALAEFCGRHDFERPHVAGNSLGAWVAFEIAKQGSAASVCAISPAGMWREALGPRRFEQFSIAQRLRPLAHLLLATGPGRSCLLGTNMTHPERLTKDEASELVFGYLNSSRYLATNEAMRNGALEGAEKIDVPVSIAWGELDRIVGRPSRTRRPPGTRYVEVPGWGHTPMWDDPEGVAEFILEASAETMAVGG